MAIAYGPDTCSRTFRFQNSVNMCVLIFVYDLLSEIFSSSENVSYDIGTWFSNNGSGKFFYIKQMAVAYEPDSVFGIYIVNRQ
jgi:hypothetical protein